MREHPAEGWVLGPLGGQGRRPPRQRPAPAGISVLKPSPSCACGVGWARLPPRHPLTHTHHSKDVMRTQGSQLGFRSGKAWLPAQAALPSEPKS